MMRLEKFMQKSKKSKKKQINHGLIKNSLFKIVALLLAIGLNWSGLLAVTETLAYYNDQEQSPINFIASIVDFSLNSQADFIPAVTPDQAADKSIYLSNDSGFDLQHDLALSNFTGDSNLCDNLMLNANLGGTNIYSGRLLDFTFTTTTLAGSSSALLELEAFLAEGDEALKNKTCNFNLHVLGWQIDSAATGQGFTDDEIIANSVSSGDWIIEIPPTPVATGDVIINEIMWMGSRTDDDHNKIGDEWIELKNMTDQAIDIGQWLIANARNNGNDLMIPASNSIPANGYFLIANNPRDSANTLIDVEVDEVNNSLELINDYNSNGPIILKDAGDNIIDQTPPADDSNWPAGANATDKKWSMERNLDPTTGWHTCDPTALTFEELTLMSNYWKINAQNYNCGTPGAGNLSVNNLNLPAVLTDNNPGLGLLELPTENLGENWPGNENTENLNENRPINDNTGVEEPAAIEESSEAVPEPEPELISEPEPALEPTPVPDLTAPAPTVIPTD